MCSREGHVTEEKGEVPRKKAGEGLICVFLRLGTHSNHTTLLACFCRRGGQTPEGTQRERLNKWRLGPNPLSSTTAIPRSSDSSFTGLSLILSGLPGFQGNRKTEFRCEKRDQEQRQ